MTDKPKAVLYMMLSVASLCFMQLFINMSGEDGDVFLQIFSRNFLGMILCIFFIRKEKISYFGDVKSQPYLLARSLVGFLGLLFTFYAMQHALLADATIVMRTGPFFTTIISAVFLREKLSKIQFPVLAVIFLGGWLAADPKFDSSFIPLGCALLAALCQGICYPLLRYFSDREHGMTVIMHFSTFCCVACMPFILKDFVMPEGMDVIYLILIAITGALGQIFLTYAYRLSPAAEIAIYDQFSVVFSVVLGFIFLGQIPAAKTLIGGGLIVSASLVAYIYNIKHK